MSNLVHIIDAASRRVNAAPWWRMSLHAQAELARLAGISVEEWRWRWERRLERNRRRRTK